ncbi:hypothetical protein ABK040_009735 [Willaertia magna]
MSCFLRNDHCFLGKCIVILLVITLCNIARLTEGSKVEEEEENWNNDNDIYFAQSTPLEGPSSFLGREMRDGILAAFHEVNRLGGVWGSKKLRLISLDDRYEPVYSKQNTDFFLNNVSLPVNSPGYNSSLLYGNGKPMAWKRIFGLMGYVGTPTTQIVFDELITKKIPLIGSTGARWLRTPFNNNIINIRASYDDEATAMVNYLVNEQLVSKLAVFYQNDSFGMSGFDGSMRALNYLEISLSSSGTYTRNTLNVEQAFIDIAKGNPGGIICFSLWAPTAKFIKMVKDEALKEGKDRLYKRDDIIFTIVSFVGSSSLTKQLLKYAKDEIANGVNIPIDFYTRNVLITQVVPSPTNLTYPIVQSYQRARKSYIQTNGGDISQFIPTFIELEGYVIGKFIYHVLLNIYGNLTRSNFLYSVYNAGSRDWSVGDFNGKTFVFDAVQIGPFKDCNIVDKLDSLLGSNGTSTFNCDVTYSCNQGLKVVYLTSLKTSESSVSFKMHGIPFTWYSFGKSSMSTCISDIRLIPKPPYDTQSIIIFVVVPVVVLFIIIIIVLSLSWSIRRYYLQKKALEHAPKSGKMAIIFTDIQNSSVLWQKNAKAMKESLEIHNQIMRTNIARFKGYEVKTNGDSFYIVFKDPLNAIDWAIQTQHDLLTSEWPSDLYNSFDCRQEWDQETKTLLWSGLRVRMGINFGKANCVFDQTTKRNDYFGTAINRAARIEASAHGGQILVSEKFFLHTWSLAKNSIYTEVNFSKDNFEDYVISINSELKEITEKTSSSTATTNFSSSISGQNYLKRDGYVVHDLGEFSLKGLQGKTRLFQVKSKLISRRTYSLRLKNAVSLSDLEYAKLPPKNNTSQNNLVMPVQVENAESGKEEEPIVKQKSVKRNVVVPITDI